MNPADANLEVSETSRPPVSVRAGLSPRWVGSRCCWEVSTRWRTGQTRPVGPPLSPGIECGIRLSSWKSVPQLSRRLVVPEQPLAQVEGPRRPCPFGRSQQVEAGPVDRSWDPAAMFAQVYSKSSTGPTPISTPPAHLVCLVHDGLSASGTPVGAIQIRHNVLEHAPSRETCRNTLRSKMQKGHPLPVWVCQRLVPFPTLQKPEVMQAIRGRFLTNPKHLSHEV